MDEIIRTAVSVFLKALLSAEGFLAFIFFVAFLLRPGWREVRLNRRWAFVVVGLFFVYALAGRIVTLESDLDTQEVELEDQKPQLVAHFEPVYYWEEYTLLIVLTHITNAGGSQSIAHDFELSLQNQERKNPIIDRRMGTTILRFGWGPNQTDMVLFADEFVQHRSAIEPIEPGDSVRGWLLFEIVGNPQLKGSSISFKDALGRSYSIPLEQIQEIPPLPSIDEFQRYPDITYPFRERTAINKLMDSINQIKK